MTQLINQVDNTVFEIDFGESENKWWDGVENIALRIGELRNGTNLVIDLFQNLVVGLKTGSVFGASFVVEILRI